MKRGNTIRGLSTKRKPIIIAGGGEKRLTILNIVDRGGYSLYT